MRGWTYDFTSYEPDTRAAGRSLPVDFDCDKADVYLDAPRAPEVLECERCNPRACHALLKQGRTLKPDCAAFLVMDAPARTPSPAATPPLTAQVLDALREHGPQTMQDLTARLGVKYGPLRKYVARLVAAGRVAATGERRGVRQGAKVYALVDNPPPPPTQAQTRPGHAQRRAMNVNQARIVALLRADGPLPVATLAAATGLHSTTILDQLRRLEAAGAVRQAGTETRVAVEFYNRRYKVTLWAATEEDHE